jgi:predicted HD phosphohydrolase
MADDLAPATNASAPAPSAKSQAAFTAMDNADQADWMAIVSHAMPFNAALADRVLAHLRLLDGDFGGFPIDRLHHSRQAATLAHRAGKDEEYVVAALLHDIGDTLGSYNHPDIAAAILKPFVSEQMHWTVANHGVFQGYYYFHHLGLDRDLREQFRGHPHFESTADFCAHFDQNAFDSAYNTMPLDAFEPMVRRVFAAPKRSIYLKE